MVVLRELDLAQSIILSLWKYHSRRIRRTRRSGWM